MRRMLSGVVKTSIPANQSSLSTLCCASLKSHIIQVESHRMKSRAITDYPTFLVIGAQKCGTSWIANMVQQHPQVAVAQRKEVHFFDYKDNYDRGIDWYRSQFEVHTDAKAIGEFTPGYFGTNNTELDVVQHRLNRDVPRLIHESFPDLKLVLSLRNPVDRAISSYYHHVRRRRIPPDNRILEVSGRHAIFLRGCYDIHLKSWLRYFSLDRFLVLIYEEDLADNNKQSTISRVFNHIGVEPDFEPDYLFDRYNAQWTHFDMRSLFWPSLLGKAGRALVPHWVKQREIWRFDVSDEERQVLREAYSSHNKMLEAFLERKLPWD